MPSFPADQPAVILFTSGSTGRPRPHLKTWGKLVRSALAAGHGLGIAQFPAATIIGTVPQQHSYGLESTVMLALQHGLVLHRGRPFDPADIVACIAAASVPRILVTTPVHLRALVDDAEASPSVDLIVSATARRYRRNWRLRPNSVSLPLCSRFMAAPRPGSWPYGARSKAMNGIVSTGSRCIRTPRAFWAEGPSVAGRVLLGDIIELRSATRFRLQGRTADLVNIAGKRTSLAHLNYHLNSIPGVRDGVFVMPDESESGTTRLMALVVAPSLTSEAILAALRTRIDPIFLPRPLRLVDHLPRNVIGKLTREAIAQLADRDSG